MRESTATAWYCQICLAVGVALTFMLLFSFAARQVPGLVAVEATTTTLMGVLLGCTILVALLGDAAQGVLAGCHHQGTGEYVSIGSDLSLALAMILVLLTGGGVGKLAAVTLATRSIFEALRVFLAVRVCEGISFHPRDIRFSSARDIFRYGIKSSTGIVQELVVHQLARLVLVIAAGPAALACYSRYTTLIRQIARAVDRMTVVVPSMTSGLVGLGREGDVVQFNLRASNAAVLVLFPMIVVYGVFGSEIVSLWMGPDFVVPGLAGVLAVMATISGDRMVATGILSGLNSHGRISLICLIASLSIFCFGLYWLYPLDPLRAGVLVSTSMTLGVSVPHFLLTCRRLGIGVATHFREVYFKPMISNVFFLLFMLWADDLLGRGDYPMAVLVAGAGASVLVISYWVFAFDAHLRAKVRNRVLRLAQ